ncbi:protein stum homolog [Nelusetta ayraudi]|uniref:protein stum homolog n=1 Tax=Nelusetta ayraudi TaxID=303726 RepID=UPI003F724B3D
MAQKDGAAEQGRVTRDSLGAKAMSGAAIGGGGGVVVEVREKKGPLRAAIPTMPFPLAVICLFLNTFIPGLGTLISAFAVLCGARNDLISERGVCCVFWLNVAAALIQLLTAVIMVGWIMSIFWGMDMVILASYREQGLPQDV